MGLTAKQQKFVDEYIRTGHITRSAIFAGYSEKTAYSIGSANLKKVEILDEISRRTEESAMGAAEVLMRLANQARGDMADFVRVDSNGDVVVDLTEVINDERSALIKKLTQRRVIRSKDDETTEDITTSIELYSAHDALVDIGRHHALFTDKTLTGTYDIDLSKLTDEQLDRVANGEDVMQVIIDGYIASNQSAS